MSSPLTVLSDEELISLHSCDTLQELSQQLFGIAGKRIPTKTMTVMPLPHQFGHPFIISNDDPELRKVSIDYINSRGEDDIWMQRSPPHPSHLVLRHTDHTPTEVYLESDHYKNLLSRVGVVFALMANFWEGDTPLVWMGFWRKIDQGDYSDEEVAWVEQVHPHFHTAIRNIAKRGNETLRQRSLCQFVDQMPIATVMLNSAFKIEHVNPEGRELLLRWEQHSEERPQRSGNPTIPETILQSLRSFQNTVDPHPITELASYIDHQNIEWEIHVHWFPTPDLAAMGSTLLLQMEQKNGRKSSTKEIRIAALARLSLSERRVAELIADGLSNREIAFKLGRSPATIKNQAASIFRKLGIDRRQHVVQLISQR